MQHHDKIRCGVLYDLWDGVVVTCRQDRGHIGDHVSTDAFDRPTFRWPNSARP